MSTFIVPTPDPADSDSVSESLLTASAELARGEHREALRLLRAAAEAAEEAGNDLRALTLARAAADLANELGGSRPPSTAGALPASVAPPAPAPPAPAPPAPPPPVASASLVPSASPASLPPDLAALVESGRAVRVLVKRSARDEELYVVRRPTDGKAVLDAREALILLVEPDAAFFTKA